MPAANRFTVTSSVTADRTETGIMVLPLVAARLVRSGTMTLRYCTWLMGYTDTGFNSALGQTPLNAPTVFNYFFPDYKFPGVLAAAGLTTPEFQLTSDTSVVLQMNFMQSSLFNNSGNTNGLTSLNGGSGAIGLDIGPWMTPARTSDAGIPGLVDELSGLLCAGQLSASAKTLIVSYVANTTRFPYSTIPTNPQMRDRVRAIVHLITSSPDFVIQK